MRVLLIYPRFPKSFWSFDKTLELAGRKALMPPLGILTVAGLLPQDWEFRLIDRNVCVETQADWDWAEIVLLSGMIVQKDDMLDVIRAAKAQGKRVAVGGPYATSVPEPIQAAGADFLILDEGELTLPMFVEAIARGETSGTFRATEKPDVTSTPVPRFDLLDLSAYSDMAVQFSRGCPFQCEFCDIIVLYGRKPRTKTPQQLISELETLYDLGWRGSIFMVDDNFIGNKRNVKLLLKDLQSWQAERGYPFFFSTEASVNLAEDRELLEMMVACNFNSVFLGIETPDTDSLALTKKFQNTRNSLVEAVDTISRSGIRVMAGFIIGFDNERSGAGRRIIDFVEATGIPQALFSMLQVLPNTALWHRLKKEGRLIEGNDCANINQTTLLNFIPTRPIAEIAREYIECFRELYDPKKYLARAYRHHIAMKPRTYKAQARKPTLATLRALAIICWRQGIRRDTRVQFWQQLLSMCWHNPSYLASYLVNCAHLEHFLDYREIVTEQIEAQLASAASIETVIAVTDPTDPDAAPVLETIAAVPTARY